MTTDRLTPRQEAFCQAFIENGGNATEAYRTAGYSTRQSQKSLHENSAKLHAKLLPRIEELQQEAAKRHAITVDSLVRELEEARALAMADPKGAAAAVSAVVAKARLLGLGAERIEVTGKNGAAIDVVDLSAAEKLELARWLGWILTSAVSALHDNEGRGHVLAELAADGNDKVVPLRGRTE